MPSISDEKVIYLGSPYSHPDPAIRMYRAAIVSRVAFQLMLRKNCVYCPIAETVFIAQFGEHADTGWDFWRNQDLPKLHRCDELWICMIDGWRESKGLRGEVKYALKHNKPVRFVDTNCNLREEHPDMLFMFGVENVDQLND